MFIPNLLGSRSNFIHIRINEIRTGIKMASSSTDIQSRFEAAWEQEVSDCCDNGKYVEALSLLNNQLNKSDPDDVSLIAKLHWFKTMVLVELGQCQEAIRILKPFIEKVEAQNLIIHNDLEILYIAIGQAYYGVKDYEKALGYYEAALSDMERDDEHYTAAVPIALNGKALAYNKLGKNKEALELCDEIIKDAEDDPVIKDCISITYNNKGNILLSQGKYNEAIEEFNEALNSKNEDYIRILNKIDPHYLPPSVGIYYAMAKKFEGKSKMDDVALAYYKQVAVNNNLLDDSIAEKSMEWLDKEYQSCCKKSEVETAHKKLFDPMHIEYLSYVDARSGDSVNEKGLDPSQIFYSRLKKASEHIVNAYWYKNEKAMSEIASQGIEDLMPWHDSKNAYEEELIARLRRMTLEYDEAKYKHAQRALFETYYFARRVHTTYQEFVGRYLDIYDAFWALINSTQKGSNDPYIKAFGLEDVYNLDGEVDQHTLNNACWIALANECSGCEKLPDSSNLQYCKEQADRFNEYEMFRSVKMYRLHPRSDIKQIFEIVEQRAAQEGKALESKLDVEKFLNDRAKKISHYVAEVECAIAMPGFPDLHRPICLDKKLLTSSPKTTCFTIKGKEIARVVVEKDGSVHVKGYGENIELMFADSQPVKNLIIDNAKATVTILGKPELSLNYLAANVGSLVCKNNIKSESISIKGDIFVNKGNKLESKLLNIEGDKADLKGRLYADRLNLDIRKTITLSADAEINAQSSLMISTNSLKEISGSIMSNGELTVVAKDSIYLRGAGKILSKNKLNITTRTMMTTGKSLVKSQSNANIKITEKLIVGEKSQFLMDGHLDMNVKKCDCESLIRAKTLNLRSDEFTNRKSGTVESLEDLVIKGGSFWNAGAIKYGYDSRANILLNKIFVHGIAHMNDLMSLPRSLDAVREMFNRASITGGDLNIVATGMFDLAGTKNVRNFSSSSIVRAGLGVTQRINENISSFADLDVELSIPNISRIAKSLREFYGSDLQTKIKTVSDQITVQNVASLLRWLLKKLIPGVGKIADILYGLYMFLRNVPEFAKYCHDLYTSKEPLEFYQVVQMLQFAKQAATQGMLLEAQISSAMQSGVGPIEFQPIRNTGDAFSFAADFLTLIGPNSNKEFFIGAEIASLNINASVQRRGAYFFGIGEGRLALNSSDTFYSAIDSGLRELQIMFQLKLKN